MARVLIPLPAEGFDPTETGVPWQVLAARGHDILFATPTGAPASADPRMVSGEGLSLLSPILRADRNGQAAYAAMIASPGFTTPLAYEALPTLAIDALILPGGHAKPMRPYLESPVLQQLTAHHFARGTLIGAICHGVVLAARARRPDGKSSLHGLRTTALLQSQEMLAYNLTRAWLGDYYRTYPQTVQAEVTAALASPADFIPGPLALLRDTPAKPNGFTVQHGRYISARWPGDAHAFANRIAESLAG